MIHMLSRFNLAKGVDQTAFAAAYAQLGAAMQAKDLLVSTTKLGRRMSETPMDTDDADALRYYAVMTFRDRAQLDGAYAYLLSPVDAGHEREAHEFVKRSSSKPVFTCWEDVP